MFGAHGISVLGSSVFADNFSTSALFRVAIANDGSAGAIQKEKVAITNPERLVTLDATHMLVTEDVWCGGGRLAVLTQDTSDEDTWSTNVVKNDILGASSVTVANGSYYAVESQLCQIIAQLTGGPAANPILPFWIDRPRDRSRSRAASRADDCCDRCGQRAMTNKALDELHARCKDKHSRCPSIDCPFQRATATCISNQCVAVH